MPWPLGWPRRGAPLVLAGLVLLCVSGGLELIASPLAGPLDRRAEEVVDGIAARAAITFAIARSINAALSFAQEISVSFGLVIEGSVNPAKALEPIDDLIEQFAGIMLAVAVAALVLKVLLGIGAAWGVSVVLAAALAVLCLETASRHRRLPWTPRLGRLGISLLLVAFVLRLALPSALVATDAISNHFLAEPYAEAEADLRMIESKAEAASDAVRAGSASDEEDGWFSRNAAAASAMIKGAFGAVADAFGNAFGNVVTLVTVFLFETVLLPAGLVWLFYRGFLTMVRPQAAPTA